MPSAPATPLPKGSNLSPTNVTVGTPRRSSSAESWKLHDVHDPQSASAATTTSHCSLISSTKLAGTVGSGLLRQTTLLSL